MAWRLYEMICVHFVASLLPDATYEERRQLAWEWWQTAEEAFRGTKLWRLVTSLSYHRTASLALTSTQLSELLLLLLDLSLLLLHHGGGGGGTQSGPCSAEWPLACHAPASAG